MNFESALNDLKRISGITDYKNYRYDEEKINHKEFKSNYLTINRLNKGIQMFRSVNKEKFEKYAKIIMGIGSRSPCKIMPTLGRTRPVVRFYG